MVFCACKKSARRVAAFVASVVSRHDLFEKKGERKKQPSLPVEPEAE
jgi:hypothetical protein